MLDIEFIDTLHTHVLFLLSGGVKSISTICPSPAGKPMVHLTLPAQTSLVFPSEQTQTDSRRSRFRKRAPDRLRTRYLDRCGVDDGRWPNDTPAVLPSVIALGRGAHSLCACRIRTACRPPRSPRAAPRSLRTRRSSAT